MREVGNFLLDEKTGYVYFRIDTTDGCYAGKKVCRLEGDTVYFWDDYARIARGYELSSFMRDLERASDEVSRTGKT